MRMMPASSAGIDRNGECEDSSVCTTVGLPGKAASASSMNLRCMGGCSARSRVHTTYVRGTEPQPSSVSVVAPAAMPAGASGVSSPIAASATSTRRRRWAVVRRR